jgi:hypothetical protein
MFWTLLGDALLGLLRNSIALLPACEQYQEFTILLAQELEVRVGYAELVRAVALSVSVVLFLASGYSNFFGSLGSLLQLRSWKTWSSQQALLTAEKSSLLLQSKIGDTIKSKQHLVGMGVAQILFAHAAALELLMIIDEGEGGRPGELDVQFWLSVCKMTSIFFAMRGLWHLAVSELQGTISLLHAYSSLQKAVVSAAASAMTQASPTAGYFVDESSGKANHVAFESMLAILEEEAHWLGGGASCLSGPWSSKVGHDELLLLSGEIRRLEVAVMEKGMGGSVAFEVEEKMLRTLVGKMKRNIIFYLSLWVFNSVSFLGLGLGLIVTLGPSEAELRKLHSLVPTHSSLSSAGNTLQHSGLALEALLLTAAAFRSGQSRQQKT